MKSGEWDVREQGEDISYSWWLFLIHAYNLIVPVPEVVTLIFGLPKSISGLGEHDVIRGVRVQ